MCVDLREGAHVPRASVPARPLVCRAPVCLRALVPARLPACPPAHASPHRAADGAHPDIATARGKVATIREISNIAFVIFGPRRS